MYSQFRQWSIRWLEEHRGLVIVIFCLPASFLFDICIKLRQWFQRTFLSAPEKHIDRVHRIQSAVAQWNQLDTNKRRPMCTARPNWLSLSTTFFRKDQCHQIAIDLFDILSIDETSMSVRVEPNVTVADVTRYLIPKGYTLAVTLEIGDATVGGLAFGVGMTTYSHKVGLYQETVISYDIVLSDGSLINVRADNEYADLYRCLPWSHGTLGFLVAIELSIIRVKPYIHLKYLSIKGKENYCHKLMELSGALDSNALVPDYLEATIYSEEDAVIMIGNFADVTTDDQRRKVRDKVMKEMFDAINCISKWYKPWFYKHAQTFVDAGDGDEYIPLRDYLLRHNRAIFWVLESMIPFGNDPWFRYLLGWMCPPKPAFLKLTTTPTIREMTFAKQVFQDIVMPLDTLSEQISRSTQLFDTFPLLVYPCRIYDHGLLHQGQLRPPPSHRLVPGTNYAMFNDLGIYGTPGPVRRHERYNPTSAMRDMEKFTRDVGGYSFLYADIFMDRTEFEEMFDLKLYDESRHKYSADGAFPHLYDKVKPELDVIAIGNAYGGVGK